MTSKRSPLASRPPRRARPLPGGAGAPLPPGNAGSWLLVVAFVAGAALMAYEIVGSRLLAPFFGNSTFVWGSLIGVFLGALALGYTLGGRLADRRPTAGALATVLAAASVLVAVSMLLADPLQRWIVGIDLGVRLNPLVASVLLFGPASVLVGMVSPWAVRLRAGDLARVGSTAGSLYGLSTAGSIVGTLAASFWLVQSLGSESTVLAVAVALACCALIASFAGASVLPRIGGGVALGVALLLLAAGAGGVEAGDSFRAVGSDYSPVFRAGGYQPEYEPDESGTLRARSDSTYHRIRVVDYDAGVVGDTPSRVLHFDNSMQAAARIDDGRPSLDGVPLFAYLRGVDLLAAMQPDAERVALVGLGSGAAAMRLHELRPELRIDVVEIDPEVVEVARKWFGYRDSEAGVANIRTHVGDGRSWLAAQDEDTFDAIFVDAYFADSIPFHLTTREFLEMLEQRLADDGIAMANLIGAVEGPRNELLRSLHRTWGEVFDDIVIYPVPTRGELTLDEFINVELYAAERGVLPAAGAEQQLVRDAGFAVPVGEVLDSQLVQLLEARYRREVSHDGVPVLTDDLAPVDQLMEVDGL